MAVYVGTKSHFQSLANNRSSNRQVSFVNLYFLISHFPRHEEEEGWETAYGPSNLAALHSRSRRWADRAEHAHHRGATCGGAWWALTVPGTWDARARLRGPVIPTAPSSRWAPGAGAAEGKPRILGDKHMNVN